jgi:hypothetical protein
VCGEKRRRRKIKKFDPRRLYRAFRTPIPGKLSEISHGDYETIDQSKP